MCETILMPNGREIDSIRDDYACLCNSTPEEIVVWIVQHLHTDVKIDERLIIVHTPFGWDVEISREVNKHNG